MVELKKNTTGTKCFSSEGINVTERTKGKQANEKLSSARKKPVSL
jgi:hypothetical protein